MAKTFRVDPNGYFTLSRQRYQIPAEFTERQIHSYCVLLERIPDQPSGTTLSAAKRRRQENYFMRRALAAVIPGLPMKTLERTPMPMIRTIHRWIQRHRPQVMMEAQSLIS